MAKYFISKDNKTKEIVYLETNNLTYDIRPKKGLKIKDAIEVDKMIIINPSMIKKLAFKKLEAKFKNLIKIITQSFNEEDDDEAISEALTEANRLKVEAKNKYDKYLEKEEINTYIKKIEILEIELRTRLKQIIINKEIERMMNQPQEENEMFSRRSK